MKYRKWLQLSRGLLSGGKAYNGPFNVALNITQRCNLRCLGCQFQNRLPDSDPGEKTRPKDMSWALYQQICSELAQLGTKSITLIGDGEPLLHPELPKMIGLAKEHGFHVTLLTNGTLLSDAWFEAFVSNGLDVLQVSCWGSNAEDFARHMKGAGEQGFDNMIEKLTAFAAWKKSQSANKPVVRLNYPITRYNYQGLAAIVDRLGFDECQEFFFSALYVPRGGSQELMLDDQLLRHLEVDLNRLRDSLDRRGLKHNVAEALMRYRVGEQVWRHVPCYIGWIYCRIGVDGSVAPCRRCDLSMGRVGEASFREIWNSLELKKFRRIKMSAGGMAEYAKHCDCGFCCHLKKNRRIDRVYRMIQPLNRLLNKQ